MDSNSEELAFLSNLGLMLTYKCTIACPHCIVEAGPHRKEEMPLEHALAWIEQARAYRNGHIQGLALTGGEPFYNLQNLARLSAYGHTLGFIVSVVTNAYWASTPDTALHILADLPGIQLLSVSTDVYHQKAIPFEYIKNAVGAAKKLGRLYNIAVCTDSEEDPAYQRIIQELDAIGEADNLRVSITFPVGRAQKQVRHFHYQVVPEPTVSACSMAGSPVVFPDGRVIACIGPLLTLPLQHPMFLGNLHDELLATILNRAETNLILHAVRVWGPHKLVSLLKQHGFDALLPAEYICNCICDVCYKLLSDPRIIAALDDILQDEQLRMTLAYARVYYLNETAMAVPYRG